MTSNQNSKLIFLFVGSVFLVTVAMMVVIFVATRRPVVVVLPQAAPGAGVPAVGSSGLPIGTGTTTGAPDSNLATAIPEVPVIRAASVPSVEDPMDPAWNGIPAVEIPLEKQQSAEPLLEALTITELTVQAARDDQRFIWRISWPQTEACFRSNVGEFSDAVAIQFPLKDGAPYTMGGPGMPVTMLYWKALWQADVDQGFQDMTDIYPNFWYDFYWFASGKGPQPVEDVTVDNKSAQQFMSGVSAGNPMSEIVRTKAIEELKAEGFGSSTHVSETTSNGRGVWKDGKWYVVFDRPIKANDPLIARFNQNPDQQLIAFAVWDGNAQNRGARKHITNWIPMRIQP